MSIIQSTLDLLRRPTLAFGLGLVLAGSLSACDDEGGEGDDGDHGDQNPEGEKADSFIMGVIVPTTGPAAQAGVRIEKEIRAGQHLINNNGGLWGKNLALDFKDSKSTGDGGLAAANELIQTADVINGAVISGVTSKVLDVTVPAGKLVINGASGSDILTKERNNGGLFVRTAATVGIEAGVMADEVQAMGGKHVAIMVADSAYTQSLAKGFQTRFETLDCGGAPCKVTVASYDPDSTPESHDYIAEMTELLSGGADMLFLSAYAVHGVGYLDASASAGFTGPLWVSYPVTTPEVQEQVSPDVWNRLHGTGGIIVETTKEFTDYLSIYETANGGLAEFHEVASFDIVALFGLAASSVPSFDAAAVGRAMIEISRPPGVKVGPGDYAMAQQLLKSGQAVDFDGASGPLDLDDNGDVTVLTIEVWKMVNGQRQQVKVVATR